MTDANDIRGAALGEEIPRKGVGWIDDERDNGEGYPEKANEKVEENRPAQEVQCEPDIRPVLSFHSLKSTPLDKGKREIGAKRT